MPGIPDTKQIEALVAARASESVTLEFKAEPWVASDGGKRECLKDITSLANTAGGLILVGIKERGSAADAILPLTAADAASERTRIADLVTAGVEPRLYGVQVEAVSVSGGVVLALAIPRSPSRPHRVTSQGTNKFWLRNSTGAYEANVADLRRLFLGGQEFAERAERYHLERAHIAFTGDVMPTLAHASSHIIFHVIPASAFELPSSVDLKRARPIL
jgi:predicted HTH transcriptional regulator